ncbi:MAG: hypothetical protein ACQEVA_16500, partial [Myxococcota bacterium]
MERLPSLVIASLLCTGWLTSCGPNEQTGPWEYTYETEASACQGGPPARTLRVDTNSQAIGSGSNALVSADNQLWVVES